MAALIRFFFLDSPGRQSEHASIQEAARAVLRKRRFRQIVFPAVKFRDDSGELIPELTATFAYDCFFDGTVFGSFYFLVESDRNFRYKDLKLFVGTDASIHSMLLPPSRRLRFPKYKCFT